MPTKPYARCPACKRLHPGAGKCPRCRGTTTQRGYGWDWQRLARDVLADWRAEYGDLCPGWRVPTHEASPGNPLTVDHAHAMAKGGTRTPTRADVLVLCKACNTRKHDE